VEGGLALTMPGFFFQGTATFPMGAATIFPCGGLTLRCQGFFQKGESVFQGEATRKFISKLVF
jgi:hypothetical protein